MEANRCNWGCRRPVAGFTPLYNWCIRALQLDKISLLFESTSLLDWRVVGYLTSSVILEQPQTFFM